MHHPNPRGNVPLRPLGGRSRSGGLTTDDSTGQNICMPIKFRCPHCRQFLGVSRSKAGSLADCPSCGRALRIPQLDGKVEKVSAPELNLNNTGLRKALDSLAQLAVSGAELPEVETYSDEHGEMPVPHPEAEPSLPLVASNPKPAAEELQAASVILKPPHQGAAFELSIEFDASTADEHQNGKVAVAPAQEAIERAVQPRNPAAFVPSLAALAQLAEAPDAVQPMAKPQSSISSKPVPTSSRIEAAVRSSTLPVESRPMSATTRGPSRSKTPLVLASFVSLLIGGGLGAFVMQSLSRPQTSESDSTPQTADDASEAVEPAVPSGPVSLTGRVNYVDADGQSRPDTGSRILVLPADREGSTLLPAEAFRSGADAADHRIAEAALAAMGGAFVTVNESGEYSASLPTAARFHVLILSQHLANDLQGGHAAELLADYVDRPTALLGHVAWTVVTIRHQGSGTQSVDHTFVPPQGQ